MKSEFDIKGIKSTDRESMLNLARLAESSERFDEMCCIMKKVVELSPELTIDERNLLSIAYKNVVGSRRTSWRAICSEIKSKSDGPLKEDMELFKKVVEKELQCACKDVLALIQEKILPNFDEKNPEGHVFFLKMVADYFRYLAETDHEEGKATVEFYEKAFAIAEKHLEKTHPTRLGLVLNYTVCIYEIVKQPQKACQLAKRAFDEALSQLDTMDEDDYKDSTLIMQLLRDNITLWTSDGEITGGVEEKEGVDEKEKDKDGAMKDEEAS